MTDQRMDARLRAAGERWRAATTATVERPDEAGSATFDLGTPGNPRRRSWVTLASVAVVAAAVVVGGALFAVNRASNGGPAAESAAPSGAPRQLAGATWTLGRVAGPNGGDLPGSYSAAHLSFTRGRFTASDLCHTLSGPAKLTPDSIYFGDVAMTEQACTNTPPATAVIDAMLSGTIHYEIRGTELILTKAGNRGGELIYRYAHPSAGADTDPADLIGPEWRLTETATTGSGSGSGAGYPDSGSSVRFGKNAITVNHRCAINTGQAQINSGSAVLSEITVHPHSCPALPNNADDAAARFLDALLRGNVQWSIKSGELTITKGARSATFESQDTSTIDALTGNGWTLDTITRGTGPNAVASSTPAVVFHFAQDMIGTSDGSGAFAVLRGSSMMVKQWTTGTKTPTGPRLAIADSNFVYGQLLVGTVSWKMTGDQLTISKPGVGALTLAKQ